MDLSIASILSEKISEWYEDFKKYQLNQRRPMIIGISGPQGIGKSTLTNLLQTQLSSRYKCMFFSIDDFYFSYATLGPDRRGPPGTHDLKLLYTCLQAAVANTAPIAVPRFDKTLHGGQGDRLPTPTVTVCPVDLVFIEGWLVGFRGTGALAPYARIVEFLDHLVHLVPSARNVESQREWIAGWRAGCEPKLAKESVMALVHRIWPYYAEGFAQLVATRVFQHAETRPAARGTQTGPTQHHVQVIVDQARKFLEMREVN